MTFLDELRQLDPKDIGRWPALFRGLAVGVIFLLLSGVFIYLLPMSNQMPELDRARHATPPLRTGVNLSPNR